MRHLHRGLAVTIAGLTLAACVGCPFRNEKITIARDGAVRIELVYQAGPEEFERFDALPSADMGWKVEREIIEEDPDQDGKTQEKVVLSAERRFSPHEALPRTFVRPGDRDADLVLDFPTEVRIERRLDGTYYYFKRVYTPRRWAYVDHWNDMFIDDEVRRLSDKPVEELTENERRQIIQSLAAIQAFRQVELAQEAVRRSLPYLRPEFGLMARQALLSVYEDENDYYRTIMDQCEAIDQERRDDCYGEEADRVLEEAYEAYVRSLRVDAGLTRAEVAAFEDAYAHAKRYHEITNMLGGHGFEIEVVMPGTIIAHNGEKVREGNDGRSESVVFQFDGKAFRDRPHELLAVSRVGSAASEE